jgi:hypothetical protein
VSLEEAQAVLAALALLVGERKRNAAYALAELLSPPPRSRASLRDTCGVGSRRAETFPLMSALTELILAHVPRRLHDPRHR